MSLKDTIQTAVTAAYTAVDSMTTAVIVRHFIHDGYDVATRSTEKNFIDHTSKAVLANYTAREIDNVAILPSDVRVVIKGTDIPLIEPGDELYWTDDDKDKEYEVVSVLRDPALAVWQCQARMKSSG